MITNKIVVKFVLFCILIAAVIFFLSRDRLPFGKANTSFATDAGRDITRIEFTEGDKHLELKKVAGSWITGSGEEIRKYALDQLLGVLHEMKIKSPVSEEMFSEEVTGKGLMPVRVRIYNKMKIINSFYVYRTKYGLYGNMMKKKPRSKPFITYVPGYEGDIGVCFTADELYWKPFILFRYLPSGISQVSLENLSDAGSSFTIMKTPTGYELAGKEGKLEGWDSLRVERYLTYFFTIPFEQWAPDLTPEDMKKITEEEPLFIIRVVDLNGSLNTVKLWQKRVEKDGTNLIDPDRLWGMNNITDRIFIVKYFDIDPVIKKRSYFFQ